MDPHPPFTESATVYDIIYSSTLDYPALAARVAEIVTARAPGAETVLEAGCGTGLYLAELAGRFDVTGFDVSEEMLAVARARLPGVALHHADMARFDLGVRFDAVLCLFSSIGYMTDRVGLDAAYGCFRSHLDTGGIAVVEPWFEPGDWEAGRVSQEVHEGDGSLVVRVNRADRTGATSILDAHHLVSLDGGPVAHFHERHVMGLFGRDEHLAAFEAAGFDVEHDPEGLMGRGIYIAAAV